MTKAILLSRLQDGLIHVKSEDLSIEEALEGFKKLVDEYTEANLQNDGWISVEERMPEPDELVLTTEHEYLEESRPRYINIARFFKDNGNWYDEDGDEVYYPDYWQPLPKPPLRNK